MTVRVRLLGEFRRHLRGRAEPLGCELAEDATVADLLAAFEICPAGELIVGINGQLGKLDSRLAEGDEVVFVSPMSGGSRRRRECRNGSKATEERTQTTTRMR